MTLSFPPDVEAALRRMAQERGVTVEQVIVDALRSAALSPVSRPQSAASLQGTVVHFDRPADPACDSGEWEAA